MDKRKYSILLVILGILVIIGISYAYFTSDFTIENNPSSVTVTTATIDDVKLAVEGRLTFDEEGILPGHKNVSSIKVTALSDNTIVEYNLIWKGINSLNSDLKYYVYRTTEEKSPSISCIKTQSGNANFRKYFEECENKNFDNLGAIIYEGTIKKSSTEDTTILATNQVLKGNTDGNSVYYYVVLEFVNEDDNQNIDIGKGFDGVVTVEETEANLADITIGKIYLLDENGEKKEVKSVPESGYTLDKDNSSCENGTELDWDNDNYSLIVKATQGGTTCNITMKEYSPYSGRDVVLLNKSTVSGSTTITAVETSENNNKLFTLEDDFGLSYYFRGKVNNNWVKFGKENGQDIWWRIIRINGNGSIRMIYAGSSNTNQPPGVLSDNNSVQVGEETMIVPKSSTGSTRTHVFSSNHSSNAYFGYMYGNVNGATYNEVHANINDSDIKVKIDNWYEDNLKDNYSRYLDFESGFCNDREVKSIGSLTGNGVAQNNTSYAPYFRVSTVGSAIQASNVQTATLKCTQINNDMLIYKKASGTKGSKVLKYPIGLITMDEILLAGGKYWDYNTKFYLYNNKSYWTMSPAFLAPYSTHIMYLQDSGYLNTTDVSGSNGIRPVVNLRSDTPLIGLGTIESPYVIEGVE